MHPRGAGAPASTKGETESREIISHFSFVCFRPLKQIGGRSNLTITFIGDNLEYNRRCSHAWQLALPSDDLKEG